MIGYRLPTHVHIAPGARNELGNVLRGRGLSRALLVLDPGLSATEWPGVFRQQLKVAGVACVTFDGVEANPRVATAAKAAELARSEGLDSVVAVGGGSAMDCAKAAAMLASNDPTRVLDYTGKNLYDHAPLPFVAVPTTCGTGSEVTWVSVLSDPERGTKISVKGESMFPDQALVDADLLATLPSHLVASTGADALTHAMEATTCTEANAVSDAMAETAIRLLFESLPRAVADPAGHAEDRAAVMRASTLAGLSFGNADVAGVHCLSESMGGMYDVPHGLANAILLGPVFRSHRPHVDGRLAQLARTFGWVPANTPDTDAADHYLARLDELITTIQIPSFQTLKLDANDSDRLAQAAVDNGSNSSNPRAMGVAEYRSILDALHAG